jgi:hypothetical protein
VSVDGGPEGLQINTNVPQSARVYDYWLGGKDNYPPDRAMGEELAKQIPTIRTMVRAQRAFLARAVQFLARDAGVRQFLDVGTGIPTFGNVHEVAQEVAPESRVLYVDNDPIVLAHARALMTGRPEGRTAFIAADLRSPEAILADPTLTETLDLEQPVALMLIGILHHLRADADPYGIVTTLLDRLPSGSYFVIAHPGSDFDAEAMVRMAATAEQGGIPYVPRSRAECAAFFTGLEMVDPGLVPIPAWRPDEGPALPHSDPDSVWGWCGVGRKP